MDNNIDNSDIISSYISDIESTKKRLIIYIVILICSIIGCIVCNHFFISLRDSNDNHTLFLVVSVVIFLLMIFCLRLVTKIFDCFKSLKYNKERLFEHELDARIGKRVVIKIDNSKK